MEDDYTKLQMQVADLQLENKELFNNKEMNLLMKDRVESADKEIEQLKIQLKEARLVEKDLREREYANQDQIGDLNAEL